MYSGGSGTALDPYLVSNAQDLYDVRSTLGAYFLQTTDIDLGTYTSWEPIGSTASPFTGNYNGDDNSITNLVITVQETIYDGYGLFGVVSGGTIEKCSLIDINVTGETDTGGLVGYLENGRIESCTVTGALSREGDDYHTGGIAGYVEGSVLTYCTTDIVIDQEVPRAGGIAGRFIDSSIATFCKAIVDITVGEGTANRFYVGGFFGVARNNVDIRKCCALGTLKPPVGSPVQNYMAAFIGYAYSVNASDCYVRINYSPPALGGTHSSGFGMDFSSGLLSSIRCYTASINETGNSTDVKVYTLIAEGTYCYVDFTIANAEALQDKANCMTTTEMKIQSTYETWDFDSVWAIDPSLNNGYPYLQWEDLTEEEPEEEPEEEEAGEGSPIYLRTKPISLQPGALTHLSHLMIDYSSAQPIYIAVEYRYNRQAVFSKTIFQKVHEENGAVYFGISALEFRIIISCASAENFRMFALNASYKVVDKRAIRGIYVQ
jgi:hypothetical protein